MLSVKKISRGFSRAADNYERYADIQNSLAENLLDLAVGIGRGYNRILDIGCGTGKLARDMKLSFPQSLVFGLDISPQMVRHADSKGIDSLVGNALHLPFQEESIDLIVSNAVYQWVIPLEQAFQEALRILRRGGNLIFNCFGWRSLEELRSCFGIDNNLLPDPESVKSALNKANFSAIDFKVRLYRKNFDNLIDLLTWLKYIGANMAGAGNILFTPEKLAKANHSYCSNYRNNANVYATFEIIQVKASRQGRFLSSKE